MKNLTRRLRTPFALATATALAFAGLAVAPASAALTTLVIGFESAQKIAIHSDFGNNASSVVTDAPAGFSGTNALKIVKGSECWAGTTVFDSGAYKLFDPSNKKATVKVYSPVAGADIKLKFEDQTDGTKNMEADVTSVVGWKVYTFDYSSKWNEAITYNRASIFVDFSCGGSALSNGEPFFVDNLAMPATFVGSTPRIGAPTKLTFEDGDTLGLVPAGDTGPFGGLVASIAAPPAGAVTGAKALKLAKGSDAQVWAGVNMLLGTSKNKYTSTKFPVVTMNFYSSVNDVPVMLKLDGATPAVELKLAKNAVKGWQKLTFDFSTAEGWNGATEYPTIAFFPNFLNAGAADQVFWVDNLVVNGGAPAPAIPVLTSVKAVSISGTTSVGSKLTAVAGTWSGGAPDSTAYAWLSCTNSAANATTGGKPADCTIIGSGSTYTLKSAQKGKHIRVIEVAKNTVSTRSYVSASKGAVS